MDQFMLAVCYGETVDGEGGERDWVRRGRFCSECARDHEGALAEVGGRGYKVEMRWCNESLLIPCKSRCNILLRSFWVM